MSIYTSGTVIGDQPGALWQRMIDSGFWGETESEVLGTIVLAAIRGAVTDGLIKRPEAEVAEEGAAPGDPEAPRRLCKTCGPGVVDEHGLCDNPLCPDNMPF